MIQLQLFVRLERFRLDSAEGEDIASSADNIVNPSLPLFDALPRLHHRTSRDYIQDSTLLVKDRPIKKGLLGSKATSILFLFYLNLNRRLCFSLEFSPFPLVLIIAKVQFESAYSQ